MAREVTILFCPFFPEKCMKLKNKWTDRGGGQLERHLYLPMVPASVLAKEIYRAIHKAQGRRLECSSALTDRGCGGGVTQRTSASPIDPISSFLFSLRENFGRIIGLSDPHLGIPRSATIQKAFRPPAQFTA